MSNNNNNNNNNNKEKKNAREIRMNDLKEIRRCEDSDGSGAISQNLPILHVLFGMSKVSLSICSFNSL